MAYFSDQMVNQVWAKGMPVPGIDSNIWRKDFAGAWINRTCYGRTDNKYGWEIDHLLPEAKGGTDDLTNLNPLQWENNRAKGDNYPEFQTSVTSNGNVNVNTNKSWRVN